MLSEGVGGESWLNIFVTSKNSPSSENWPNPHCPKKQLGTGERKMQERCSSIGLTCNNLTELQCEHKQPSNIFMPAEKAQVISFNCKIRIFLVCVSPPHYEPQNLKLFSNLSAPVTLFCWFMGSVSAGCSSICSKQFVSLHV